MQYDGIKSEFIRKKIKGRKWQSRGYINNLIRLEDFLLNGSRGFAGAMHYNLLRSEHEKQHEAIFKELKPKEFEGWIGRKKKEEAKDRKQREIWERRDGEKERRQKEEWIKAGGKLK